MVLGSIAERSAVIDRRAGIVIARGERMNWYALQQVEWRTPAWMLMALMPLLFNALVQWRKQQWTRYAEPHLQAWALRQGAARQHRRMRVVSIWAFWILLAVALAGPRLPLDSFDNKRQTRHDMDLMIVLDVSASMATTDVAPTRLARAKLKLQDLLPQLHGERVGLIVYAGEAGMLLPLTHDMAALEQSLALADASLFTAQGSHLAAALDLARRHLNQPKRARAILLISDSETSSLSGAAGEAAVQAAHALNAARIPVYVLTIASNDGGVVPVVSDNPWQQQVQTISRPDFASYRELFSPGGGRVEPVSDDGRDLNALYTQGILSLPATKQQAENTRSWRELFAYPLALALLLLLLNHLRWPIRTTILMAALASSTTVQADDALWREAYAAYSQQQYLLAQQYYRGLSGYQARMGEGAAAYRRKDFLYANRQFTQALLQAKHNAERADALLNLGNSFFYAGNLRAAADAFAGVLRYRAEDERALENLARVRNSLRARSAMAPQQDGIPGRKGRGLGQTVNNSESSRGMEDKQDESRLLGSLDVPNAAGAQATGQIAVKPPNDIVAERRAALKKLELLNDRRAQTVKQMLKQDASNETPTDLSPW